MHLSIENKYPGLAHFSFHQELLVKLGQHLFKNHPFIFELESRLKTRIDLDEESFLALGQLLIAKLSGVPWQVPSAVYSRINGVLNYFINIPSYADSCHSNILNKTKVYQHVLNSYDHRVKAYDFQMLIQVYFMELCYSLAEDKLKRILMKVVYETPEFQHILIANESPSIEQLLALLLIMNEHKQIESNSPRSIFSASFKHVMLIFKQDNFLSDDLSLGALAFLKMAKPEEAIDKVIRLLKSQWEKEIGCLDKELVKEWRDEYENAFLEFIEGSKDSVIKAKIQHILLILMKFKTFHRQHLEFVNELSFSVAAHFNASVKSRCMHLIDGYFNFIERQAKEVEGLYEPIRALFIAFSSKGLADPQTKTICQLYKTVVYRVFDTMDPILEEFEILNERFDADVRKNPLDWRKEIGKLMLELNTAHGHGLLAVSANTRWLAMKVCIEKVKTFRAYIADLKVIAEDLKKALGTFSRILDVAQPCGFVVAHFRYLLTDYNYVLRDVGRLQEQCQCLHDDYLDVLRDISKLTHLERPAALSQFFLRHNVNKNFVLNCKKETSDYFELNVTSTIGCK